MKSLELQTHRRTEFIDITQEIQQAVTTMGLKDGVVTVFVPHTTGGITINENADPDVMADMDGAMERMVPWSAGYAHGEGNSAAHVKASLVGSSVRVILWEGRLQLGTWQAVYFCEFDGPRTREVWIA